MKLVDLLRKANGGYPDGKMADYFHPGTGDLRNEGFEGFECLAHFLVVELSEKFDPDADDEAQIKTAVQQIDTAVAELLLVRNALQPNPKFTEGLEEWVEILTQYDDFFSTDYSGYWLRKIKRADGRTLAWEDDEQHGHGEEPNMQEALEAFEADQDVPEGYFVIDRDLAVKAWFIGVSKYGESWYENGDSTTYDVVLQLALLGEIRYG